MQNNFDNAIRDLMNNPPEIPFDKKAWDKMQRKLTTISEVRSTPTWTTWLPTTLLALAILFGSISFFKYSLENEKVLLLEKELQRVRMQEEQKYQQLSQQLLSVDTIYQKHIVTIYDTIRLIAQKDIPFPNQGNAAHTNRQKNTNAPRAISKTHRISGVPLFTSTRFGFFSNANPSPFLFNDNKVFRSAIYFPYSDPLSIAGSSNVTNKKTTPSPVSSKSLLASGEDPYPFFPIENRPDISRMGLSVADKKKSKKTADYYLSHLQPSGLSIGATVGTTRQMDIDIDAATIVPVDNTSFGLRTEINYGERFSVLLGLEYFTNKYEAYAEETPEGERRLKEEYPAYQKQSDTDILYEAITDFSYLQIPIAIQYRFLPKKKLHPYLGLGLISKSVRRSQVELEHLANEFIYEVTQTNLVSNHFQVHTWFGYAGFQFEMTRNWQVLLEARSEFDISNGATYKYENGRFLKFNTGLQYLF